MGNLQKLNPGYNVKLYDNDDCKQFLIENMSKYFSRVEIEPESVATHTNKNFLLFVKK